MSEAVVVDASAFVDLLAGTALAQPLASRLRGCMLHAPAHVDAQVLSALARLQLAARLSERQVSIRLDRFVTVPLHRHALAPLLPGAWRRRHRLRVVDALYVELAAELGDVALVTTDGGLAYAWPRAELIG